MSTKIDGVLEEVGPLGKYQLGQLVFVGLVYLVSAFHIIAIVFYSITPDMRCQLPEWSDDTYSVQSEVHNLTIQQWIPLDANNKLDSCRIFKNNDTGETTECDTFIYSRESYWGTTLNERFGLVCSFAWVGTAVKVSYVVGLCVGTIFFGILGDWIGRKWTASGGMIVGGICGVIASFSVNIYMFAVFRSLTAMCFIGGVLIVHNISMEITGPSKRTTVMAIKKIFWPIGLSTLSILAYFIQDWNWFQLAISIPAVLLGFTMIWALRETPHVLITKGRLDEAVELFAMIAVRNGRPMPKNSLETLKANEDAAKREKLKSILKAPVLLKRIAVFFYLWFVAGLSYYGLAFNVGNLSGSVFINNLISGVADMPAAFLFVFSAFIGRKKIMTTVLMLGSISLIGCGCMYTFLDTEKHSAALITVAMLGKFAISAVFGFDYFWSSEVFPTTLRSTLVGLCSLCARIGSILSPVIVDMYMYVDTPFGAGLGALIFGITMFIGGLLALYPPETNNMKIPETIMEANNFMTSRPDVDDMESSNELKQI